ncbi:hypothetical protein CTheo_5938 [Ceratobasidium theobromae]|uniref:Transcription and mRNA export factor SUS1 n=1 Tax=Ceratobasidium theobromae TaxID=1582974 RepID=A0A5N5QGN3_9AGAM|nr:hypothetical protein CTheo_5938 [Ceratobasidium theobromae]
MSKSFGSADVDMDEVETLRKEIQERMMRSQDWDRLMRALRVHLQDRGWYDEITSKAQAAAAASEKPRFNDVYSEIHDFAISSCPEDVRAELLKQIRAFIAANVADYIWAIAPGMTTTANPKAHHYAKQLEGALCRGAWLDSHPAKDYGGTPINWEETFRKFKKHCPGHDAFATIAVQTQTLATLLLKPEPTLGDVLDGPPPEINLTPEGLDGDADTVGAPFSLSIGQEYLIPQDKREEARMALVALSGEDEKVKDTWVGSCIFQMAMYSFYQSTTVLRAFFAYTLDKPHRALKILGTVHLEGPIPESPTIQTEPPVPQTTSHFAPSTTLSTASTMSSPGTGSALQTILSRTGNIAGIPVSAQRTPFSWGAVEHIRTRCVQGMSHERVLDGDSAIAAYEAALPLIGGFLPRPGEQDVFEERRELWRWVEMLLYRASVVAATYRTPEDAARFMRVYSVFAAIWPPKFRPNHRATLYTLYIRTLCLTDARGIPTWRDEARRVVGEARVLLGSTTVFPRAGQINHKVLDFTDGCMALWEAGGESEDDTNWVIDVLWWATRYTFHSFRVLRHLSRLLFSVPEPDINIARRIFSQYVRLVDQARRAAPGDVDLQLKRRPTDEPAKHPEQLAKDEANAEYDGIGPGRMSAEQSALEVEKIRQGDVDEPRVFVDALVRGIRMLVRAIEEYGVEDALKEAQDTVKLAVEVVEASNVGDDVLKSRVYRAAGIVESLTAAKGAFNWYFLLVVGVYTGVEVDAAMRPVRQATALKYLTEAVLLDPTSADAVYHLAFVQAEARATADAILSARTAVERAPGDVRGWHLLSLLLTASEDWAGARAVIELGIANADAPEEVGHEHIGTGTGMTASAADDGVVVRDFGTGEVRSSSPQGIPSSSLPAIVPPTGTLPPSSSLHSMFVRPGLEPDANPSKLRMFSAATQIRLTHMAIVERIEGPDGAAGMWPGVFAWYAANAPSALAGVIPAGPGSIRTVSVEHGEEPSLGTESVPRMEVSPASPTGDYDERDKDKDKDKGGKHLDLHKKLLSKSHRHVHELSRRINPKARRRMSASSPASRSGSMSEPYQASSIHSRHLHRRSSPATSTHFEADDFDPLSMSASTASTRTVGTEGSMADTVRTTQTVGSDMTVTNPPALSLSRAEAVERRLLSDIWLASSATFRRSSRPVETQAAIAEAEWLDEANPGVWVQFGLYLGQGERAIESLHKALVIDPEHVAAVVALAQLYLGAGEASGVDLAAGMLSQITQGAGWDAAEAWYLLGRACGLQGRRERQRACLAHALRLEESKPIRNLPHNAPDGNSGCSRWWWGPHTMASPASSQHKPDEKHIELAVPDDELDATRDAKLIRRVDYRLMPILCVLYALSLIDRVNLGSARVEGLGVTLKFEGYKNNKYSVALLVFFIGYFLFELPSTLVLRRLHPRNFLTIIIILWGATTLGMGFVHSWKTLAVCRAILGSLEAGFFPACVYLISSWYKRYEVQQRLSVFYMSSVLASGFASILAYGLARMHGLGGLEGWRWIFIMLGIVTIVAGAIGWLLIVDFPDKATFLTEEERRHVIRRLDRDRGDGEHDPLTTEKVLSHLSDWKIWTLAVAFACSTMPAYSLAYFIPIILRGLGFSVALSNILVAPPYVFAVMLALFTSWWSDRIRLRTPFIVAHSLIAIAGFTIVLHAPTNGVKLFGTFLAVAGTQPQMPFIIGLLQNNSSKRAVASGVQVAFGAIGGIAASTVYQEKDAPKYVNGLRATIVFHAGIILTVCSVAFAFYQRNKKLDREAEGRPSSELDAMSEKERALALWRHTV